MSEYEVADSMLLVILVLMIDKLVKLMTDKLENCFFLSFRLGMIKHGLSSFCKDFQNKIQQNLFSRLSVPFQ